MRQKKYLSMIVVVGALQLGFCACGKKEPPENTPDLTIADHKVPAAEAEAVGVSGPLELTLRVYKTKIKSEKESLWYQIQLRNIGDEEIRIFDSPFLVPTMIDIHGSVGASLQVTGPDGKRLKRRPHIGGYGGGVLFPGSPTWPVQNEDQRAEAAKKVALDSMWADRAILRRRTEYEDDLRRKGASEVEINRKSLEFDEDHPQSDALRKHRPSSFIALKPGAAITNLPWSDRHRSYPDLQKRFSEFVGYWYTQPGKYRISARFNNLSSDIVVDYNKDHGIPQRADAVLIETETIEFEVGR